MTETLAQLRERLERRYWCDLFTRLPRLEAAARVADLHPELVRDHIRECGVDPWKPVPPDPPLARNDVGLRLAHFLERHERRYWRRLFLRTPTIVEAAQQADVNRATVYRRMKELGLKPWRQPGGMGGNEAWRALGA